MDFLPLIIRPNIELSVSKTNFSFLKHLFCWYEGKDFSYCLYKKIAFQTQAPTNNKERKYICFNQAYKYLLNNADKFENKEIMSSFFKKLYGSSILVKKAESQMIKNKKKIQSFFDLCDYQVNLSLNLPFSKPDNLIVSLMFFNMQLLRNGYRTIKIATAQLDDFFKLYNDYCSGKRKKYYQFLADNYNCLPFQNKNFYTELFEIEPNKIMTNLIENKEYLINHFHFLSISLFGSFADGDYRLDSDIDLFVTIEQGLTYSQKEALVQEFKNYYQNVFHRYIDLKEEFIPENIKRKIIYRQKS